MNTEAAPSPDLPNEPALSIAERQLVMLGELAELAMGVTRVFAASAIASAEAARAILTDKYFMPEIGRAQACGAKDAAESFQKVSRAVRLTLMLEKTTAEFVRDLRAGVVARPATAEPAHFTATARLAIGDDPAPCASRPEADSEGEAARVERPGGERERRFDIEYADRLPRGAYCRLVDELAADIGATVDWESGAVSVRSETGLACEDVAKPNPWLEPARRREQRQGFRAEPAPPRFVDFQGPSP